MPELPKDPDAILAAAAPYYDFNDPAMKPWHMKATYQMYDEKDHATAQGTYEYWWASPAVQRSSWSRNGASSTVWHTADGNLATLNSGEPLSPVENRLQYAFLRTLPKLKSEDTSAFHTILGEAKFGQHKLPCIFVLPPLHKGASPATSDPSVLLSLYPAYCFDPHLPALRFTSVMGNEATQFNNIVGFQNKFLAKEIVFADGQRKQLSATVDSVELIDGADAVFTPAHEAVVSQGVPSSVKVNIVPGKLIKRVEPDYPQDAQDAHVTGVVALRVTIGKDGAVSHIHVISSPMPSLAAAAERAVAQWRYTPFQIDEKPVEMEMTINVVFGRF